MLAALERLGRDPARPIAAEEADPIMIPRYSRPEMARIWEPENRYRI